jgi:hypothetical protein
MTFLAARRDFVHHRHFAACARKKWAALPLLLAFFIAQISNRRCHRLRIGLNFSIPLRDSAMERPVRRIEGDELPTDYLDGCAPQKY